LRISYKTALKITKIAAGINFAFEDGVSIMAVSFTAMRYSHEA
jgi:hypothetical protein